MMSAENVIVQWFWDGESYDEESNKEIEAAFQSGKNSVKLTKGYFGQYGNQGIYEVHFNRITYQHKQKNINAKSERLVYRIEEIQRNSQNKLESKENDVNQLAAMDMNRNINPCQVKSIYNCTFFFCLRAIFVTILVCFF